jgi:hypothetical protein
MPARLPSLDIKTPEDLDDGTAPTLLPLFSAHLNFHLPEFY